LRAFPAPQIPAPDPAALGEPTQTEINARNEKLLQKTTIEGVEITLKNRKANTTKTYKKAQEKWAKFCGVYRFNNGLFINSYKLLLFI